MKEAIRSFRFFNYGLAMPSSTTHPPFEAYRGANPYVFVCYAHSDSHLVFREIQRLKEMGINVWYDEGIDPGSEWPEEIARALDGASLLVFFVSPRSVASINCKREVYYALNANKKFVAIHIEKTEMVGGLNLSIGHLQAIIKHEMNGQNYEAKLRVFFQKLVGLPNESRNQVEYPPESPPKGTFKTHEDARLEKRNEAARPKETKEVVTQSRPQIQEWSKSDQLNRSNCKQQVAIVEQSIDFLRNIYKVDLATTKGPIRLQFFPDLAPGHVKNFVALSKIGFYDGLTFHRVIEGFMIQGGCPLGTGSGDGGYKIKAEFNKTSHQAGVLSMARSNEPNSAGTQFFICHEPATFLDGKYTAFGKVADKESQDTVNTIALVKTANEKPVEKVVIQKATVTETARA